MGSDNDAAEPEDAGLRKREQHLSCLGIRSRQGAFTARPGEPAALPLALLQVLANLLGSLDPLADLGRIPPETALDGVVGEPAGRLPVFTPAPVAEDRGTPEREDRVLLEAREQIRVGRLNRQGQPWKMRAVDHVPYCPTKRH